MIWNVAGGSAAQGGLAMNETDKWTCRAFCACERVTYGSGRDVYCAYAQAAARERNEDGINRLLRESNVNQMLNWLRDACRQMGSGV